MPPNESDSSGDESGSFTTTNVLLGYASKEPTDDTFSHLGGYPTWLDDNYSPSAELAKCKICNSMMTLLLQLNGDLPERFPGHERKLYIFCCRRKACRKKEGTVRAIRGTRMTKAASGKQKAKATSSAPPKEEPRPKQPPQNLGNSLFNSTFTSNTLNQNPFSSSSSASSQTTNPFAPASPSTTTPSTSPQAAQLPQSSQTDLPTTFAQKARISSPPPTTSPKNPWPPQSALPKPYPSYHLDADYETLESSPPSSAKNTAIDIDTSSKDDEKDAFESSIDKTFQKFADRLAQNPEQVLRYEFGGMPLLYSKSDAVGKLFSGSNTTAPANTKVKVASQGAGVIPRCTKCGSARGFELQLVPQAIAELEVEEEGLEGMEWGTIMLGVCETDCAERGVEVGEVGWVEEWVGVQWEESGDVRKG